MFSRSSMRLALSTFCRSQSQAFNICRSAAALCSHATLISGSFKTGVAPMDLSYDALHPDHGPKTERPLVILHGLLCVFSLLVFLHVLANGVTHSVAVGLNGIG